MGPMDGTQRQGRCRNRFLLGQHRRPGTGSLLEPGRTCKRGCGMNPTQRALPKRIERLHDLASNLWWSWSPGAREVFRRLDYPLWRRTHHNPLQMLNLVTTDRFEVVARILRFFKHMTTRLRDFCAPSRESERGGRAGRLAYPTHPSRTSRPSLRCISRSLYTPADSVCWRAITVRKRVISGCL